MKTRFVLNTALLPGPGLYSYELLSVEKATRWLDEGDYTLAITYRETLDSFCEVFNVPRQNPPRSRRITMDPGDEALVFRLKCSLEDPGLKDQDSRRLREFVLNNCEIGLTRRLRQDSGARACASCEFHLKGKCRRNPPEFIEFGEDNIAMYDFPNVFDDTYCGEWRPQE